MNYTTPEEAHFWNLLFDGKNLEALVYSATLVVSSEGNPRGVGLYHLRKAVQQLEKQGGVPLKNDKDDR
jgi:hypothetical protein